MDVESQAIVAPPIEAVAPKGSRWRETLQEPAACGNISRYIRRIMQQKVIE